MRYFNVVFSFRLAVFLLAAFLGLQSMAYAKDSLPPEFRSSDTHQLDKNAQAEAGVVSETKVNINQADASELERVLSGVGSTKAQAIVDYRNTHGLFKSIDDLMMVKGIGAATLEKNKSVITLN